MYFIGKYIYIQIYIYTNIYEYKSNALEANVKKIEVMIFGFYF